MEGQLNLGLYIPNGAVLRRGRWLVIEKLFVQGFVVAFKSNAELALIQDRQPVFAPVEYMLV